MSNFRVSVCEGFPTPTSNSCMTAEDLRTQSARRQPYPTGEGPGFHTCPPHDNSGASNPLPRNKTITECHMKVELVNRRDSQSSGNMVNNNSLLQRILFFNIQLEEITGEGLGKKAFSAPSFSGCHSPQLTLCSLA